jgi:hypothetical protein
MQFENRLFLLRSIVGIDPLSVEFGAGRLLEQRSIALCDSDCIMLISEFIRVVEIFDAFVCRDHPDEVVGRGAGDLHPKADRPGRLRDQNYRAVCSYERHEITSAQ